MSPWKRPSPNVGILLVRRRGIPPNTHPSLNRPTSLAHFNIAQNQVAWRRQERPYTSRTPTRITDNRYCNLLRTSPLAKHKAIKPSEHNTHLHSPIHRPHMRTHVTRTRAPLNNVPHCQRRATPTYTAPHCPTMSHTIRCCPISLPYSPTLP